MNINEIARLAGVSRATVSRYMNNGYVSEEKKERIRQVIEETGYRPSSQAKMLRTKKTSLIGVVIPKINSDSISHMVAGISEVINREDFRMILANTANDIREELKYLELFQSREVDGVILIATFLTPRHKEALRACKVPVVLLGQRLDGYSCVYQDDFQAARAIAGLLLKKGSRLGYIGVTEKDEAVGRQRREGVEAALVEAGRPSGDYARIEAEFNMESGCAQVQKLLEDHPEVDSVLCATDSIAVGALMGLNRIGKKVPSEIQLAGMGCIAVGEALSPRLSTIRFFYQESGAEAARMLLDLLAGRQHTNKEIKMGFEVVQRESVR
ncbi:MAG TPA: LacI family DNA-binding transcriptional regulator [Candidatus Limivivens intestinipullorum]|uniref:LacI family DNA-binding transcriptional regulator n=1 Tax=Candidatus Limivivens intestinipullorum TaxID=2840858 RepID=A0A9D1ETL8_9FIRM|nr:LacI family DNA-binding transcriptional regulator [Candidatus Limivivens intestinipullorum]